MKRVFLLAILVMACGCKHSDYAGSDGSATLSFSPSFSADNADSRATATSFEDGDRVGVYVVKQGQALRDEFNAADNHLFEYFATGDSLGSVPMAMYYPDKSTPVAIYAYYPYKYGGERFSALAMPFNVAKNQRAEDALTLSDLCLSVGDFAAPSASPRSLTFYHALSQVVVNVDYSAVADVDSLYSVRFLGVRSEVLVNLADGALTLLEGSVEIAGQARNDKKEAVAILPPQTFVPSKLIELQMRMKDQTLANYYFNPVTPITIEAKMCNTLKLALRSGSDRAELTSDLAISPWIGGTGNGQLTERVGNDFTLIYLNPKLSFREVTRVVLTINETEYEATDVTIKDNGDKSAKIGFTLRGNAPREYPYTVTAIKLFVKESLLLNITDRISSPEVYKSGEKVLAYGAFTPPSVTIAGTKWCSTNLTGMREGNESLVIACDKPEDYGMYFKWGCSQVYAHGVSATDGDWGSATAGAATAPLATNTSSIGYDYGQGLYGGTSPGDPCKKLGANYRTPTSQQFIDLYASRGNTTSNSLQQLNSVNGLFFGPNAQDITANQNLVPDGTIFIPAAGSRDYNGAQDGEGSNGRYWSSSVYDSNNGYYLYFGAGSVYPSGANYRAYGLSIRCVEDVSPIKPAISFTPAAPTTAIPATGATYTVTITSNLTWSAAGTNCTVSPTSGGIGNTVVVTITVPRSGINTTRTASVVFTTATNAGLPANKATWQATQSAEAAPTISFTPAAPTTVISKEGATYTITMASNTTWSAGVGTNCTVNTKSGVNGTKTTITVPKSTSGTTVATSIVFTTTTNFGFPAVTAKWSATQAAPYSDANVQEINGVKWCKRNLTGTPGQGNFITMAANPQDYGMNFKWGCSQVYARGAGITDGIWGSATAGAATSPANTNTGNMGYDYGQGLSGGTSPGDPCAKMGASYRTPTRQQFIDLYASRGSVASDPLQQLKGVNGIFFGPKSQTVVGNQSSVPAGMIFIPAAGWRNWDNGAQYGEGSNGFCWSSSVNNSTSGHSLFFFAAGLDPGHQWSRSYGLPVRCVQQ